MQSIKFWRKEFKMSETENGNAQTSIEKLDEMSPVDPSVFRVEPAKEYRVSHNKVPLPLLVLYIMVFLWAALSWIPFYGY